jgi:DNA repair protein RecO (recombination protein O)
MPNWEADAIILSVRPHGEGNAIVSVLTAELGRHSGLVRVGTGSNLRGVLQPGNRVRASWRARLSEQLGQIQLELIDAVSALLLDAPMRLAGLAAFCSLLDGALPEREKQVELFEASNALLDLIKMDDEDQNWLEGFVRWELGLLSSAGYQLDLSRCVASGSTVDLAYVSPKSGNAVALLAAGNFASRLLSLPRFLGGVQNSTHDWVAGLELTGHFLTKRLFAAYNVDLPAPRKRLADMVQARYNNGLKSNEAS